MNNLTDKLMKTLEELKVVMAERQNRVTELKDEIEAIEKENEQLESTIQQILESFQGRVNIILH